MWCVFSKWEEFSGCVPTISGSTQEAGRVTATPLTWLFSEAVQVLSGSMGLPELRELDTIKELQAARPGEEVGL